MKKFLLIVAIFSCSLLQAQQFINTGMIEFEVRTNNHKSMGEGAFVEMFKDKIPEFSTSYYHFVFNDNKAIYKFDHKEDKTKIPFVDGSDEDNIWYNDYNIGTFTDQKNVFGENYLINDSLMKINWKLVPNETREIAGFTCRKAQGIIFDSVYIFAFYTDEITVSGGPMSISGLPGMILGITIPRKFTSWIATKVQLQGFDVNSIAAPTKGKKKKAVDLVENIKKATEDWGNFGQQAIWNLFL